MERERESANLWRERELETCGERVRDLWRESVSKPAERERVSKPAERELANQS